MPSTKQLMAEQILYMLRGGNPGAASTIKLFDIKKAIEQKINYLFKVEQFQVNMPDGGTIPEGVMLATYDNIPVYTYKDTSAASLPAIPVALPRNMGVYHVSKAGSLANPFIPVEAGMLALIQEEGLISNILGQTGYSVYGNLIVFNSDISTTVSNILIQLVIMDLSQYSDYDILPVPSDMETQIVNEVFKQFAVQIPTDKINDPGVDQAATVKSK